MNMKYIVTEDQIWEYKLKNIKNVFNDLLSNPDFFEDLKNYSYNKGNYVYWWKDSKEEFYELASKKYCNLLEEVLRKHKLWKYRFEPNWIRSRSERREKSCFYEFEYFLKHHFEMVRNDEPYEGDDGPIVNKRLFGIKDITKYFMEIFYGK